MNYYEHHIRDYDAATSHLTWDEDLAYTRMIRWYYRKEQPLPVDHREVCRQIRATTEAQKDAVESVLREFFELRDDGWHQQTCDDVIASFKSGEPEREIKKANEKNRLKRHRDERAALFKTLTDAGQHAPWNIGMADLRALVAALPVTQTETPETQSVTAPATPATATQAPVPKHQDLSCMQQHAAAARVIKFRRTRPSGLVTWVPDDVREAERLERENDEGAIRDACAAIKRNGKEPVPGRVSRYIDQQARAKQAADRQTAIDQRLADRPPIDEERARKGLRFLPQRLRQHAVSAGVAAVAGDDGDDGDVEEGAT